MTYRKSHYEETPAMKLAIRLMSKSEKKKIGFIPMGGKNPHRTSGFDDALDRGKVIIAEDSAGLLAGFCLYLNRGPHYLRIHQIVVAPCYRRQHVGSSMLYLLESLYSHQTQQGTKPAIVIHATVRADLTTANAFWRWNGFAPSRWKKHHTSGSTLITYTKTITPW